MKASEAKGEGRGKKKAKEATGLQRKYSYIGVPSKITNGQGSYSFFFEL
jgi:hypothetical protein